MQADDGMNKQMAYTAGKMSQSFSPGSDSHPMPDQADDRLITARDCELAGYDLADVLAAAKHSAP